MRKEKDTMGYVEVPNDAYYGAQTQRAFENFPVSGIKIPLDLIRSIAIIKKAAAIANHSLNKLDLKIKDAIVDNIRKEFQEYGLPSWFRDIVGILKISSIAMLHSLNPKIVLIGASTIAALMLGAVLTHVKQKDTFRNTIASVSMLIISILMISMI